MLLRINEANSCFSEKINKTGKSLAKLTKKKKKKIQINKIRDKKEQRKARESYRHISKTYTPPNCKI